MNIRLFFSKRSCLILIVVLMSALPAGAADHSDFFESKPPVITFDKSRLTWTLRNQAVERVVHFDSQVGKLETAALRDIRTHHSLQQAPNGEGEISFVAPLLKSPRPLTNWKYTEAEPNQRWTQAEFNDSAWKPVESPSQNDAAGRDAKNGAAKNGTKWFRCNLPEIALLPKHAYALLFDHVFNDEAEIYIDGTLVQKVKAVTRPWDEVFQVDILPASREIAIKSTIRSSNSKLLNVSSTAKQEPSLNSQVGIVSLVDVGSAPTSISLSDDWQYSFHSINANEDGSLVLTISLLGIKKHEGFDIDVNYQIYPGAQPVIAKWFTFVSHRTTQFLIEQITCEKWELPRGQVETHAYPGSAVAAFEPQSRTGLLSAVLSLNGACELAANTLMSQSHPYQLVKSNIQMELPKAITAVYQGPLTTGAFLYQLYISAYVAHAAPTSVPVLYNTQWGYLANIDAATCERIIPIAADLGVKLFVIDNGWQTNNMPDAGKYGDWIVDRRPEKFPDGLLPISDLVRERKMRFGLWTAPALVSKNSSAAREHRNWLVEQSGEEPIAADETEQMCYASAWADTWSTSFLQLCRELDVSYLKLDGDLYYANCMAPDHDHLIGYSKRAQMNHWTAFCDNARKANPNFIIDRRGDAGPEATGMQDEGWFDEWEIGADPKRQEDARWWYKNADICRSGLYDLAQVRPSFTIAAGTPCHIPTATPDLNALEYHFTSIGAYICNVELQGKLDKMTAPERTLIRKWIQWNTDNRPWLAFTQPIASLGKPWDPRDPKATPHVDGVMHLRNALNGRYGYICLWNPSDRPATTSIAFDPADYLLRMKQEHLQIVRYKDDKPVAHTTHGGTVSLDNLTLAPLSWEIYEVREGK